MTPELWVQIAIALLGLAEKAPDLIKEFDALFAKSHGQKELTPEQLDQLAQHAPAIHAVITGSDPDFSQPVPPGQDAPGAVL